MNPIGKSFSDAFGIISGWLYPKDIGHAKLASKLWKKYFSIKESFCQRGIVAETIGSQRSKDRERQENFAAAQKNPCRFKELLCSDEFRDFANELEPIYLAALKVKACFALMPFINLSSQCPNLMHLEVDIDLEGSQIKYLERSVRELPALKTLSLKRVNALVSEPILFNQSLLSCNLSLELVLDLHHQGVDTQFTQVLNSCTSLTSLRIVIGKTYRGIDDRSLLESLDAGDHLKKLSLHVGEKHHPWYSHIFKTKRPLTHLQLKGSMTCFQKTTLKSLAFSLSETLTHLELDLNILSVRSLTHITSLHSLKAVLLRCQASMLSNKDLEKVKAKCLDLSTFSFVTVDGKSPIAWKITPGALFNFLAPFKKLFHLDVDPILWEELTKVRRHHAHAQRLLITRRHVFSDIVDKII